jgi:hypothetical protein
MGAVLLAVGLLGSEFGFGFEKSLGIRAEALPGTGIGPVVGVLLDDGFAVVGLLDSPMEVLPDNPMAVLLDSPMAVPPDSPMAVLPDSPMAAVLDSPTVVLPGIQMAVLLAVADFDKVLLLQVFRDSLAAADLDRTAEAGCLDTVDRGSQVLSPSQTADVAVSSPDSLRLVDVLPAIHRSQSVPAHGDFDGDDGGAT